MATRLKVKAIDRSLHRWTLHLAGRFIRASRFTKHRVIVSVCAFHEVCALIAFTHRLSTIKFNCTDSERACEH
eukprot:9077-Heterococcus_DN1.PRE.7